MVLQILIIVAIFLQVAAALIAISLISKTKYNSSWILFTIALTVMAAIRCAEYIQLVWGRELRVPEDFLVWMGVITSLCLAIGVLLVNKIFTYIEKLDFQRQLTEKRILNTVLRTEEKERLRFSKELHDGLGPLLSSAKMSLSALDKRSMEEGNAELLANTQSVIEEAIRSLREISNNLSPHILNDFGLEKGLANFINKFPAKGKFSIEYTSNLDTRRFDTDVEVILYRVVCELINNSAKHSGGDRIALKITFEKNTINIDYSDNGKGFVPEAMMDIGMGLSNIVSRIHSLKGNCEIRSEAGKGMTAQIMIDLKGTNADK